MGSCLISHKDSLAKNRLEVFDPAHFQAILNDTSPDPLAAEQELVMALRFYTQEREQQIGCGAFRSCSSEEESLAARRFTLSKTIIFDRANVRGVASIRSQIVETIAQDVIVDAIRWEAISKQDDELKNKIRAMYEYASATVPIPLETLDPDREKFVEGNLQWCKSKSEGQFRKYYGDRIEMAMCEMLEEHRNYWAQHPADTYDDRALDHIFAFSIYGGNYGLGSLFRAWGRYLEQRVANRNAPFGASTEEERAVDKEVRRKLPIEWPHSNPNAREICEVHIRKIIREDIIADIPKGERHARDIENSKKRQQERRLERIQELRDEFISKVINMFWQQFLRVISTDDIDRYSFGIVDRRERKEDLWYSILAKYQFDGLTKSCVYFIRQGNAIKIGITDELERRFAQIKTSAPAACRIENVIYTHHGRKLERKLHKALVLYNSHLEWFVLPPNIENMLFSAKSVEDIESVLGVISGKNSVESANERNL